MTLQDDSSFDDEWGEAHFLSVLLCVSPYNWNPDNEVEIVDQVDFFRFFDWRIERERVGGPFGPNVTEELQIGCTDDDGCARRGPFPPQKWTACCSIIEHVSNITAALPPPLYLPGLTIRSIYFLLFQSSRRKQMNESSFVFVRIGFDRFFFFSQLQQEQGMEQWNLLYHCMT